MPGEGEELADASQLLRDGARQTAATTATRDAETDTHNAKRTDRWFSETNEWRRTLEPRSAAWSLGAGLTSMRCGPTPKGWWQRATRDQDPASANGDRLCAESGALTAGGLHWPTSTPCPSSRLGSDAKSSASTGQADGTNTVQQTERWCSCRDAARTANAGDSKVRVCGCRCGCARSGPLLRKCGTCSRNVAAACGCLTRTDAETDDARCHVCLEEGEAQAIANCNDIWEEYERPTQCRLHFRGCGLSFTVNGPAPLNPW